MVSKVCNSCGEDKSLDEFDTMVGRNRDGSKRARKPRPSCKKCMSIAARFKKYGITHLQYEAMAYTQNYLCLLCRKPELAKGGLVVDHDHKTGKVRGLLCHPCNRRLGVWEENYDKFTAYLEASDAHVHGRDCSPEGNMQSVEGGGDSCPRWEDNLIGV